MLLLSGAGTVHVAEGVYEGPVTLQGNIWLLGGYPLGGGERDPFRHQCVIDAREEDSAVVIHGPHEPQAARIDGFTVTGGRASVRLRDGNGGGIYHAVGSALIANSVITGNTAVYEVEGRSLICPGTIRNHTVCWPTCTGLGGGVYVSPSAESTRIINSLIHGNRVLEEFVHLGGDDFGMCYGRVEAEDWWGCDVSGACWDRRKRGGGAAIFVEAGANVLARNSTVWLNSLEPCNFADIWVEFGLSPIFFDSAPGQEIDLYDNITQSTYCDGEGSFRLSHNLMKGWVHCPDPELHTDDPLFLNAERADFRLSQTAAGQTGQSPAVDVGQDLASNTCIPGQPALCLSDLSTRADGGPDEGLVDLGYHGRPANWVPRFAGLVHVTAPADCTLRLSWQPATDPEGHHPVTYLIYRAESPGGQDFDTPIARVMEPATTWLDETVEAGTTYWYVVRARDSMDATDPNTVEVAATARGDEGPTFPLLAPSHAGGCDVSVEFLAEDGCGRPFSVWLHRSSESGFAPDVSTAVTGANWPSPHLDTVPRDGIWYYRLVARDGSGDESMSRQAPVRVEGCGGPLPPPGEARVLAVTRDMAGIGFEIRSAEGALHHRLYRGTLASLHAGVYDHGSGPGPDGVEDTGDDLGKCSFAGATVHDPAAAASADDYYFLVVGVNPVAEGLFGTDWTERQRPDGPTLGTLLCP